MKELLVNVDGLIEPLRNISNKFASPVLDLSLRLYVAEDFLRSGILRFQAFLNDSWDTQIMLFEYEHPVPGIPAELAATMTTGAELVLPILLITGLFSRFAAAGIIVMSLIIQLTYMESFQHITWIAMMAVIFIKGPGLLSADHLLRRWVQKDQA